MSRYNSRLTILLIVLGLSVLLVFRAAATAPTTAVVQAENEQTDLSGTYTGSFVCDAAGLNGEMTLTTTGNQFTTSDGKTGRLVATTTGDYTAVALQVGEVGTTRRDDAIHDNFITSA